ncbi:TPA: hypothetical protein MB317_004709 [Klebsiella quasipneumoniae subsp. similipneumoniae]|nr:hypothetical protein [Klebsiella quasipneumoniae subsp. similipneumoniae]
MKKYKIFILTDNHFLFYGLSCLLKKDNINLIRISFKDIYSYLFFQDSIVFIDSDKNDLTTTEYNQLSYLNVKIRFIVNRRKHIFSEINNIDTLNIKNDDECIINVSSEVAIGEMKGSLKKIYLTKKETLVLMLYLKGFSIIQICNKTTISKSTVHIHFNHILHKTGIKSTRHLFLLKNILNYHLSSYL